VAVKIRSGPAPDVIPDPVADRACRRRRSGAVGRALRIMTADAAWLGGCGVYTCAEPIENTVSLGSKRSSRECDEVCVGLGAG
jgi:hypothetical protein